MIDESLQNQVNRNNNRNAYKTVNAYSQSIAVEQVLTIAFFLVIITMHSVFIVSSIALFNHPILWIMLALTYILLIVMAYDYCILTCQDPVDDLVLGIKKQSYKEKDLVYCIQCKVSVHRASYHCNTCNRCVEYFDHHCRYLNNCIGGKNYMQFLRLLIAVTMFCLDIIGQGVWIFVATFNDSNFKQQIINNWTVLATVIVALLAMIAVDSLLSFHLYLTCGLKKTTYEYLMGKTESERQYYSSQQHMDTQT